MPTANDQQMGLVDALGPASVSTLAALACILLLRSKAVRGALLRAVRGTARRLVGLVRLLPWAWRLRIGLRLAGRLQASRWDDMVRARKLSGLARGKVRRTPSGIVVHLTLNEALTFDYVNARLDQLEAGLGLRRGSTRLKSTARADRAHLHIVTRDPLAKSVLWQPPAEPVRLRDLVKLSVTPFGDVVELDVKQRIGIFGTSGSGKSCVQRLIGAHVVQAIDADMVIMDLKFGTESQHFEGKARRITEVPQAADFVEWLIEEEFPRRAARMQKLGTSTWQESESDPAMVVMVDEGNVITREFTKRQLKRFFRAVEQGRALGVYFIWATQYPKATNLPTELRSQLNVRICLALNSSEESAMVFKDEADTWKPHTLPGPGWLLIKSDKHRNPEESRAIWLDETVFRTIEPGRPFAEPDEAPTPAEPVDEPLYDASHKEPTVADLAWTTLQQSAEPLGVRQVAREIARDPGAVQRALAKLVEVGAAERTDDRKYVRVGAGE